jgi:raffinose/stachyose/melibiose transport system permease protein
MTARHRTGPNLTSLAVHLALGLVLFVWMVPEAYMVSIALRSPETVFDPTLFSWPLTFDNFVTVIRDNPLPMFFLNSLIVTLATVALVLAVSSLFAFAAAVLRLPGTTVLYAILLTTLMVPLASLVLPLAVLLKNFGWVNRYIGLIIPYAALGAPFAVVILKAFLEDAPRELFEAARVDGCSAWQTYIHVALPLVRPALVFVAIWQFIVTWNEFFLALVVMTQDEMKTVTIVPMQYSGLYMANPGALFAILTIIALPLIGLYVLVQRAFVRGLLAGAVKG